MKRTIDIYHPGSKFPSLSVTGAKCKMSCDHCNSKYLKGMRDISKEGKLLEIGRRHYEDGGKGFLISGGCTHNGAVNFPGHIFDQMRTLKEETDLLINMHVGLVDEKTAQRIALSGPDRISFDLVYSDKVIDEVLHLKRSKEDYLETIDLLTSHGMKVVPHILAGLDHGSISWENDAALEISKRDIGETVLIVFIPTRGTPMEGLPPPKTKDLLDLASFMREKMEGRLILGCMRPRSMLEFEKGVLDIGFDGIVLPSRSAMVHINKKGWTASKKEICCCF